MHFKQQRGLFTFWGQYWVRHGTVVTDWVGVYVNISPFEEWQKNIIDNVSSSYKVNLAIEIPNMTKVYISLHFYTYEPWVSAMLI